MALTPNALAHKAVFDLLLAAELLPSSVLPKPCFDEDTARPTDLALSFQGSRTEAWLNLRPMDGRFLFSELGGPIEIRHMEAECMIEWVVIGRGADPGQSSSPRRDRFEDGLLEIAAAIGPPRALAIPGVGTTYIRMADQPLALAADRSILASIPNVSACSVAVTILMAVPSPIG
ncbi:hypothetical protein PbB2_00093 [Candidatus Phycosocius bacilliformis]|uniref:Uncharacterized protein n=1 Tax=Candidatus Phycosocius bacilliformis TaxID=1445552 RepID=A0A2P2E5V1_9PROT|nr:hypothetical protein [Candidatus Phycosocius bacilliformis]GBF56437.1 hypothetical protein PbB2_00093 [Candidatus Phycosocius bacilliformis]